MVLFKSNNSQKKNVGISKPNGLKKPTKPSNAVKPVSPKKVITKPTTISKPKEVKPNVEKPKSRVSRNAGNRSNTVTPKPLQKKLSPVKPNPNLTVMEVEEVVQLDNNLDVVKGGNIGEETVDLIKSFESEATPIVEPPISASMIADVAPEIKPTPVKRSLGSAFNQEPKVSRLEVKKEPLRMPKFLTGYPKISELRCKQLTTSDIISENKYAYSENYIERKEYPKVESIALVTDETDIAIVKSESKDKLIDLSHDSIVPELNFNLDTGVEEEIALSVEDLEGMEEIPLDELVLEDMEEIVLEDDLELGLVELEEPIEELLVLEDEEPLLIEEDILLEEDLLIEDETPLLEEELVIGELGLLEDISLEDIGDIEIGETTDLGSTLIDDSNLVEGGLLLDDSILLEQISSEQPSNETEGLQLTDDFEINIGENDIISSTNEEDLVELYGTANENKEEEEEEPVLVKQTFGNKSTKSNMVGGLDMGLTYDIEDLKAESVDKVRTNFLDETNDETDELDGIDMSEFLSFGESDALLSRSKNMDEALKYIK